MGLKTWEDVALVCGHLVSHPVLRSKDIEGQVAALQKVLNIPWDDVVAIDSTSCALRRDFPREEGSAVQPG